MRIADRSWAGWNLWGPRNVGGSIDTSVAIDLSADTDHPSQNYGPVAVGLDASTHEILQCGQVWIRVP
jgi:hypothetical protein